MLQLFDLKRVLIDWMIPSNRNALKEPGRNADRAMRLQRSWDFSPMAIGERDASSVRRFCVDN
jgi:hypothetical protein